MSGRRKRDEDVSSNLAVGKPPVNLNKMINEGGYFIECRAKASLTNVRNPVKIYFTIEQKKT
jgi:hypothetical protein